MGDTDDLIMVKTAEVVWCLQNIQEIFDRINHRLKVRYW